MSAWFIIGPNSKVYRDKIGRHFCASTRQTCIQDFVIINYNVFNETSLAWRDYQSLGYRCEKRRVVE